MSFGLTQSARARRILGSDRHMRIRVVMATVTAVLTGAYAAIAVMLARAGFANLGEVVVLFGAAGLFNLAVLLCIRSGYSLRFADPALTQPQIWFAVAGNAGAYVVFGEARGITPAILSLIMMFGIFSLKPRQMVANLVYALALHGVAIAVVFRAEPTGSSVALNITYGVTILLILTGSTFVGLRVQQVRTRLQRQKGELADALEHINHLAGHDELTGLVNRRRMLELVALERERCARNRRPLLLALLDLDLFKQVNDEHGHAAGDLVLCTVAACISGSLRTTDVVARWGGEEFLVLMPETSMKGALKLLERLRVQVASLQIECPNGTVRMTVSIGLAAGTEHHTLEQVIECADEALYQAKKQGRNRVVMHSDSQWAQLAPEPHSTRTASDRQALT